MLWVKSLITIDPSFQENVKILSALTQFLKSMPLISQTALLIQMSAQTVVVIAHKGQFEHYGYLLIDCAGYVCTFSQHFSKF